MAQRSALQKEIDRIVDAPYTVVLKNFYDIVLDVSDAELLDWANRMPCQIDRLAATVLEGLSLWSYVLRILERLVKITPVRDSLLSQQPLLLDDLLKRALESSSTDTVYSATCVAMLSSPLPTSSMMPASVPDFVLRMVESMVQNPCAETIRPIYHLMSSIDSSLLEILPRETVEEFQVECTKILRKTDDHIANLLCLATFAKITTWRSARLTQRTTEMDAAWLMSICHFFDSKRGAKTLDVVVLRAIFACSENTSLSEDETREAVELALCIVKVVDPGQKSVWATTNRSKVARLESKVVRAGIATDLQLLGAAFFMHTLGAENIPTTVLDLARNALTKMEGIDVLMRLPDDVTDGLLEPLTSYFDAASAIAMLDFIVDQACGKDETRPDQLRLATTYLTALSTAAQANEGLRVLLVQSIISVAGDATRSKLVNIQQRTPTACETAHIVCSSKISILQNKLLQDLCTFLAITANASPSGQKSIDFSNTMITKLATFAQPQVSSPHTTKPSIAPLPRVSFFEYCSTPSSANVSSDWRSTLSEDLVHEAHQTRSSIIKRVGEVCRDLEMRCENVEEPLRIAKEGLRVKGEEVRGLLERIEELEGSIREHEVVVKDLGQELQEERKRYGELEGSNDGLVKAVRVSQESLKQANSQIAYLKAEIGTVLDSELGLKAVLIARDDTIHELREVAERARKEAADEFEKASSEHQIALSSLQEDLGRERDMIANLEHNLESTVDQLMAARSDKKELDAQIASSDERIAELQRAAREKDSLNSKQANKIDELQQETTDLCSEANTLKEQIIDLQNQLTESAEVTRIMKQRHSEAMANSQAEQQRELRELEKRHDASVSELQREYAEQHAMTLAKMKSRDARHLEEIAHYKSTLEVADRKAKAELRAKVTKIFSLESKLQQLNDERARMMQVMGITPTNDTVEPPRQRNPPSTTQKAVAGRRRSEVIGLQSFDSTPTDFNTSGTFEQPPLPSKRSRKSLVARTPSKRARVGSVSPTKTLPEIVQSKTVLRDADVNRSPRKGVGRRSGAALLAPFKMSIAEEEYDDDKTTDDMKMNSQSSLDGLLEQEEGGISFSQDSDIFTSTAPSRLEDHETFIEDEETLSFGEEESATGLDWNMNGTQIGEETSSIPVDLGLSSFGTQ